MFPPLCCEVHGAPRHHLYACHLCQHFAGAARVLLTGRPDMRIAVSPTARYATQLVTRHCPQLAQGAVTDPEVAREGRQGLGRLLVELNCELRKGQTSDNSVLSITSIPLRISILSPRPIQRHTTCVGIATSCHTPFMTWEWEMDTALTVALFS